MATPLYSVSGLSSGLDTDSIITKLMQLEQAPITQLQNRKTTYQTKVDLWSVIRTQLSALRTSVDGLKNLSDVNAHTTAISSDTGIVDVKVTGTPSPGTLSFTVDRLATNHQLSSHSPFASADALVGAGTFTVTVGGVGHDVITTASTTLQQLATSVSNLGVGVTATVVSLGAADSRLVLSADETGTAAAFTAGGTQSGLATFDVAEDAKDAQVTIGSGPGALVVTRASNEIADLLPGVSLTLKAKSTAPVTVTTGRDADGLVDAVTKLVTQANTILSTLDKATAYDAEAKQGGPLQGDASAWGLAMDLRTAVSDLVARAGSYRAASSIGITLNRTGQFDVDKTKLRSAVESDPDAFARLLARGGSSLDARLGFVAAGDRTKPGSYAVQITSAGAAAAVTGGVYASPGSDEALTVTSGSKSVAVSVTAGSTLAQAVSQINAALVAGGIATVLASDDGAGHLALSETRFGSKIGFTVAGDDAFGLNGSFAGADVVGTIAGIAATGVGQVLTSKEGAANGLTIRVAATASEVAGAGGTLSLGSFDYSEGLVGRLSRFLGTTEGAKGSVTITTDNWNGQIKLIDESIARIQERLTIREATLRAQFTAMETALSSLQSQGNWLSQQISSFNASSSS